MKHYGLIGQGIQHSLSPKIHQAFSEKFDIAMDYRIIDVKGKLKDAVLELKEQRIDGFNVTTPYKSEIIPFLDQLSVPAERMQSVNTVINQDGKWIGDNTDSLGFKRAMSMNHVDLKDKTVLVLGAGGAAKGIIYELMELGVRTVLIYSRTRAKTNELMISVKKHYAFDNVMSIFDTHGIVADCIINTTPLGGMHYKDELSIDLKQVSTHRFIDLNYLPRQTRTMEAASSLGIKMMGGLDMLVCQALYSDMLWHDIHLDNKNFSDFVKRIQHACD